MATLTVLKTEANRLRICLVSSVGGHLEQLLQLRALCSQHEAYFIVEQHKGSRDLRAELGPRVFFVSRAGRDMGNVIQLFQMWRILRRIRPACIISTGSAPAVSAALVARYLEFGCYT